MPRYDLLDARPYNRFTVQTSRGCPWRCDFCASTVMLSQRYRKRPVEHVIRDIRAIDRMDHEMHVGLSSYGLPAAAGKLTQLNPMPAGAHRDPNTSRRSHPLC